MSARINSGQKNGPTVLPVRWQNAGWAAEITVKRSRSGRVPHIHPMGFSSVAGHFIRAVPHPLLVPARAGTSIVPTRRQVRRSREALRGSCRRIESAGSTIYPGNRCRRVKFRAAVNRSPVYET